MVDGQAFDTQVRRRARNVEALLGQSVGQKLEESSAYDHCQREVGKFLSGENHCCNCHYREQKTRCSFSKRCDKQKEHKEKLELEEIEILKRAGAILRNGIKTSKDLTKIKKTKAAMKCLKQHRKEFKRHRRKAK